jgi:hypothetical protein
MAVSTTQSIWRSGGGDQTRTAYCGSGVMVATFYVGNANTNTAAVKVSSATGAPALILPAGAVIMSIAITTALAAGSIDMGYTLYGAGTASPQALLNNFTATSTTVATVGTTNATLGTVMSATEMVYITQRNDTSASAAPLAGFITYYVTDPLSGQQND